MSALLTTTNLIRAAIVAIALVFLASCAHHESLRERAAQPTQSATSSSAQCQTLADAADTKVAAALDMNVTMLAILREQGNTDNAGVCAMSWDKRNQLMLAYRKTLKNPNRQLYRAPAKEYTLMWDADDAGRLPTSDQKLAADRGRKALAAESYLKVAGITQAQWTALGPGNVGGRIRAIVIDPRDPNRIFVGAATGGIWLSTNGGASFAPVDDFMGNIAIGSMAIDPNNPNIMYAGTGESFTGLSGIGMFKSTDGGLSWNFLQSTNNNTAVNPQGDDWVFINRIAVSQMNSNIVLAGTTRGSNLQAGAIMRSTNGGESFTRVLSLQTLDIQFDPNDANNVLAGSDDGFMYYSRDAGLTWTRTEALVTSLNGRGSTARAEIAYARAEPGTVYVSLDNNRGDIWKSTDGGVTWAFVSNPKHTSSQGDYDNTIWVDPLDANHIVTGGLDLYRSTDGGNNFTRISTWQSAAPGLPQPHADHHVIVAAPNYSATNPVVYIGNDGGLYRSTNINAAGANGTTTWQNLNNGLAITQFYGGAGKASAGGQIIGGTQDNGTIRRLAGSVSVGNGDDWTRFSGGDGGFAAVDPISDATLYGEYVYGSIRRTVNGAGRYICNGITEAKKDESNITYCGPNATEQTNFITPFILDPNARDRMLVGAASLWVTDDVRTALNPVWRAIKPPVPLATTSRHFINAVDVAKNNSNIIWVGHNSANSGSTPTHIYKTNNGLAASPTWQLMSKPGMPTATVNRVTIDPDNPNRVWVAYSGFSANRLWVTEDGGTNWRSISEGLPNITLHDVKRHPLYRDLLYVAAANGVYASQDAGATWGSSNDGPNSVRVRELFWFDDQTLVAVTFGRGMFRTTVTPPNSPRSYSDMWWGGSAENGWGMSIQQHDNGVQFNALYVYDAQGRPVWYVMPGGAWSNGFTTYSGALYQPTGAPLNMYNPQQLVVGASPGTASITFTSANTATLSYTINGISASKSISRQNFAQGSAPFVVSDLWWAGQAENGWGINLAQQQGTLFGVWYTYAPDGRATWYVLPGGAWTGNEYSGTFYSTVGSPWLGTTYNPAALVATAAGTMRLNFSSANAATFTYQFTAGPFAGTMQTKSIVRQSF
jgi:photosystem II stability/assembly factor-like uncharacterized protein